MKGVMITVVWSAVRVNCVLMNRRGSRSLEVDARVMTDREFHIELLQPGWHDDYVHCLLTVLLTSRSAEISMGVLKIFTSTSNAITVKSLLF
jgi:hypothetical protein